MLMLQIVAVSTGEVLQPSRNPLSPIEAKKRLTLASLESEPFALGAPWPASL